MNVSSNVGVPEIKNHITPIESHISACTRYSVHMFKKVN